MSVSGQHHDERPIYRFITWGNTFNEGRGIRGSQVEIDKNFLSADTHNPFVGVIHESHRDMPRLSYADWIAKTPDWLNGFTAKSTNVGIISTGDITLDLANTSQLQAGIYRLICTADGGTGARFKLIAPNTKEIKSGIQANGEVNIENHFTLGALAITTAVSENEEWQIPVYKQGIWTKRAGSIYIKKSSGTVVTTQTPGAQSNTDWALLIDGSIPTAPATQGPEGILTRNQQTLLDGHTVTLAAGASAATPIITADDVPVAAHAQYDPAILFSVEVNGAHGDNFYISLEELDSLTANDSFDIGRAHIIYESTDTSFSLRLFKKTNGDLSVHKRGGSGSTAFDITATYFYWTETYDRVALAIHDIIDEGWADEGYLSGINILGPVYLATETDAVPPTPTGGTVTGSAITAAPTGWSLTELMATEDKHFVWASYCLHRSDNSFTWLHPILEAQSTALRQAVTSVASHTGQIITQGDNNAVGPVPAAGGLDERFLVEARVHGTTAWARTWLSRETIDTDDRSDTPTDATMHQVFNAQGLLLRLYVNASGQWRVFCSMNTNSVQYDIRIKSYRITEGMERIAEAIRKAGGFSAADETKLDGLANVKTIGDRLALDADGRLSADAQGILNNDEVQLASQDGLTLLPNVSSAPLISNADLPADNADWIDDRIRIRAGRDGETLTETWTTPAVVRNLIPSDTYTVSQSVLLHTQDGIELRLRRVALGHVVVTRFGGSGAVTFEVHISRQYFTEAKDRVAEALREIVGTASVPPDRLVPADGGNIDDVLTQTSNAAGVSIPAFRPIPRKLPPVAGQFAVYRRVEDALANPTDLASGRLQFYGSAATGGTNGNDREVLGTRWRDILGNATNGLGFTTQNSKRRFMLVHRTEFRNRDLSPFYHQLGYHYWTYPLQVLVFAGHGQWVLFSGNLIGNSAAVAANHCNFFLERVIDFDLSNVTPDAVIPYDLQIKWGYQGDTDTILPQRVPHTRYLLGGAAFSETNRPTLADWDGSAFATGNANGTTEVPPAQDDSTSTHLWILTAVSTRTAGRDGSWSTTGWTERRATDPDSTTFSAQWSPDTSGNEQASGPWYNRAQDAGLSGTIRFRLDNGEWFYASYGPPPNPPELQVQYSATETGTYTDTVRTTGWYRFKLSTETTWSGPFRIASAPPTDPTTDVEYSANSNGPWSTTVRTSGYYRWKLSTETEWNGPFLLADNTNPPAPTLDVQYSATEGGTFTSTVRTSGFYRFRYNNGPWIGPSEIGATPVPDAGLPDWYRPFEHYTPFTTDVFHNITPALNLDDYEDIEFRTQTTGADGAVGTHRMRIADIPVSNYSGGFFPSSGFVKLTHTRDGLQVAINNDETDSGNANGREVGLVSFQRPAGITTGRTVNRVASKGLQISAQTALQVSARVR